MLLPRGEKLWKNVIYVQKKQKKIFVFWESIYVLNVNGKYLPSKYTLQAIINAYQN